MTVTKQQNGKWIVDISDGFSHLTGDRIRHRKKGFKTRKEAEQYEADYRINHLHQFKPKDRLSVNYLYSLVRQEDQLRGNKKGTIDTQESYYTQYASKFFADADMKLVTINDIKDYRDWLIQTPSVKGGTLSNSHINQQMIFIHKLFEVAIAKRFRTDNPCNGLKRLPEQHKEMSYYTPEQFKLFDSCFTEEEYRYQLLYRVLMFTGARLGEALALTWNNVNLNENYIDIVHSAYYRKNQVHIGTVKTTQSRRRIYIHSAFATELKDWKDRQKERLSEFTDDLENLQIFQDSPEVMTSANVTNFKTRLRKRLPENLKMIRNHDFRHSHAAFLINQGLRNGEGKDYIFFTLMKRLGHSSINTTINVYSHLFPSQQKEVANAFDNF
ncbi:tyrosine recombinase xerC-like protein [Streptococcus mutans NMT4863]|uniref:site-specific integrase n=1 Tax=Streptococcus mutans TaxID=1309 RepID=UPI0002B58911|nr:site-specific integrase [Streptococcus mutans]EMB87609.1 tyrosine recombinase xerC-like protein [Streptococcus mutans NMT4863]MCB5063497.1 site-specific integrase [Streptococcus mutans]